MTKAELIKKLKDANYVKGIFVDEHYELNSNGETVYSVMLELANGHRVKIKDFYYPEGACTFADSEYEKWLKERDKQRENQND